MFGLSALLSVLTAADGYIVIPEEATGLDAGTEVDVTLYACTARSSETCRRHGPWRPGRRAGTRRAARNGCPPSPCRSLRRPGLVTAAPVWATRSSPPFDAAGMDGIAIRAADTLGASETTPGVPGPGRLRRGRHRRPDARRPGRGRDARARALRHRRPGRAARGCPALPARPLDRRGRQRRRAAAARKATGCVPPTWPRRPRPARRSCRSGRRPLVADPADRRRDRADRNRAGPGRDPGHQLADARRAGARGRVRGEDACRSSRTPRSGSPRPSRRRPPGATC